MTTRNSLVLPEFGEPEGSVNRAPLQWGGTPIGVVKWANIDAFVSSDDVAWLRATAAAFTQAADRLERAQAGTALGITGGDGDA